MATIDYGAIALITIFTSFFAGLGSEIAKEIFQRIKNARKRIGVIDKNKG
jgi:hypothetical protein